MQVLYFSPHILVREILPEIVTQVMLLLSSGEGEQEEVRPLSCICMRNGAHSWSRLPSAQAQKSAESLAKELSARLWPFSVPSQLLQMHGHGKASRSCYAKLCAYFVHQFIIMSEAHEKIARTRARLSWRVKKTKLSRWCAQPLWTTRATSALLPRKPSISCKSTLAPEPLTRQFLRS